MEVITGPRRRRHWTAEEKARIVAESFEEGANISEVARRHGVVRGLLMVWRRKFPSAASFQPPGFVPVRIASESGPASVCVPTFDGLVPVALKACDHRVGEDADLRCAAKSCPGEAQHRHCSKP
ncbi:transposase [Bradyrhizobium sp. BRP22]|uniref:IS66-like element accessory protein TnpA n=1 Tax=Bradyrhizobium sp. BRP22 TaxID=2793821 RepID=UPI0031FC6FB5